MLDPLEVDAQPPSGERFTGKVQYFVSNSITYSWPAAIQPSAKENIPLINTRISSLKALLVLLHPKHRILLI